MAKLVSDAPGIKEKMEEVHEPPMSLAQLVFRHGRQPTPASEAKILGLIKERQMAPYYARVCAAFGWSRDEALYTQMAAANAAEVEALKVKLVDAEENSGDMEVLDALFDASKHRARVGDRDGAYEACDVIRDRPKISTGKRIDAVMLKIRVALFFEDVTSAKKQLEEAKGFAKDGGDWDRNNRLAAYESAYLIVTRDLKGAAKKLLGGVATFTCVELCTYPEFVFYAVVTNVLDLPRPQLKKKIIDSPEVLQVIKQIPHLSTLVESLYECDYATYFLALMELEKVLLDDRYFSGHSRFVIRELRVLVYTQFLDAYKTVNLASMAAAFGVSVAFIDGELARFIACGRLNAKVDKVDNVVHTTRADLKSKKYQEIIKSGDVLLNRIQQLARVVSI
jgi:26S proteasome regulatory subunit N7